MKYAILTFGCRVNQADSFDCENDLQAGGATPAGPDAADLVVVNTCSVTASADRNARRAIRRVMRVNPRARIVATGCAVTASPADFAGLPGVVVLPNDRKSGFATLLRGGNSAAGKASPDAGGGTPQCALRPGAGGRTAFPLRVQTGCDESCSYCRIPGTRGPSRSRPLADVLEQARRLADAGFKELWLTGVHLGAYGRDLSPASSLLDLLRALDHLPGDLGFRISSIEPADCTPAIVDLVARSGRFAPHLHLPLQHACDRLLAAMGRPYSLADYRRLVDLVRDRMPDAAIGCDLIAGFPGETDADFDCQRVYLRSSPVSHLHVFPYSERPGTRAAVLTPKVDAGVRQSRAAMLQAIGRALHADFVARQVGSVRPGLTLRDGSLVLTDNYLKVRVAPGRPRNERVRVRLSAAGPLRGEVVA